MRTLLSSLSLLSSLLFSPLLFPLSFPSPDKCRPCGSSNALPVEQPTTVPKDEEDPRIDSLPAVNWQAAIALMADDCLPPGDIREVLDTVTSTCAGYVAVVDIPPENIMEVGVNDRCAVRPQGRRGRGDRGGGRGFFFCSKTVPFIL